MSFLSTLVTLTGKELRVLARDLQALGLLFGMPALLVFLLSLALKDIYNEKVGQQLSVILEVEDDQEAAASIERSLREEGNVLLVERPAGKTNRELFRAGDARAVVRIPAGFSARAEEFVASRGRSEFGPSRIEWEASPTLDASYRRFLEARLAITCLQFVQAELVRANEALGAELEEMGDEMGTIGDEMEALGTQLEEAVAQLENTSALLGGDQELLLEVAAADALDGAARREAEAIRARLLKEGRLPKAVPGEEAGAPPVRVLKERIDYTDGSESGGARDPAFDRLDELRAKRAERESARTEVVPAGDDDEEAPPQMGLELFLRESLGERASLPTPLQQTVPGWSLFAMFFVVVPLSQGFHRERAEGTLRRMLALAVPRTAIVIGKLTPYALVGLFQFGGMLLIGLYAVPAVSDLSLEFGREPWVLLPITCAASLAASSYGLLVASLTRTPEQAAAFGATSVVILSVISGIMVPHFMMPELLQKVALISPLYWGQKAYLDAFLHDAGIREVAQSLYVLGGFALLCILIAARRITPR